MAAPPPKRACAANADGYEEVAVRVKPSADAAWDLPNGSIIDILDEWVECNYEKFHGFIKTKNLPGVNALNAGEMAEVKDSYKGNSETCMRRHAEQDSTTGNVLCYVPNGPAKVKLVERWVEFRWKGAKGFAKARHIGAPPADGGVAAVAPGPAKRGAAAAAPAARGGGAAASSSGPPARGGGAAAAAPAADAAPAEPPRKKAKVDEPDPAAAGAAAAGADEPMPAAEEAKPAEVPAVAPEAGDVAMKAAEAPEPVAEPPVAAPEPAAAPVAAPAAPAPAPPVAAAPAPAAPAAPAKDMQDCQCCFDSVSSTEGTFCPSKAHFFCAACLGNFLTAFKTADYAEQKKGKGRALCPMKCSEVAFGDGALAAHVDQDVFDEYLQIRIKVAEQGIQEQMEKENRDKIEELKAKLAEATGSGEQVELDKHRLKIIDDIFTLKCPRCKAAFLDYDNCSAITCASCSCGFCSYCLEDCGKDAHKHFYDHKSVCPKEGGPLFIDHKSWQGYQNRRKSTLLRKYLAELPEDKRKKVGDLVAPDAKDLGVEMPDDYSAAALDPEAHGYLRVKLSVPQKIRPALSKEAPGLVKEGMTFKAPEPKVAEVTAGGGGGFGGMNVPARIKPDMSMAKKNVAAHLPNRSKVTVDDEWAECNFVKEKMKGWVKAKHVVGRPEDGKKAVIKDAGGHGSVLVRKDAKQEEGKNSMGFVSDNTEVTIIRMWTECLWEADPTAAPAVKAGKGFLLTSNIADDDVTLQGLKDDVWEVVKKLEEKLGLKLNATKVPIPGSSMADVGAKGGKGGGRGRGRGRGRG